MAWTIKTLLLLSMAILVLYSPKISVAQSTWKKSNTNECDYLSIKDEIHQLTMQHHREFAKLEKRLAEISAGESCKRSPEALLRGIPDENFSASSICCPSRPDWGNYGPECSRFGDLWPGCDLQGWASRSQPTPHWIEVDLGVTHTIVAVGTKGRGPYSPYEQWETSYKLASLDDELIFYDNGKILPGNVDTDTEVKNDLCPPLVARKIRLYGAKGGTLRWELYGFKSY